MPTVWKFPAKIDNVVHLAIPKGAAILHAEMQGDQFCVWALVDPSAPLETRVLRVAGTGHPILQTVKRFVNTFLMRGGSLVFHVFEIEP